MIKYDFSTVYRCSDSSFHINGDILQITEMFPSTMWNSEEYFTKHGIHGYEPMTAKELDTEELQDEKFNDSNYIIEEKFDGTRALVYFFDSCCRVFSRRISKKTGFYVENTDSVPQIRETYAPDLAGTILDGEMFIDGLPFKEVSSTLNCLWDKAVDRQIEKGFITFHAFDILFYRGIDLRKFPLFKRKKYLHIVIEEAGNPYIREVEYHRCGDKCDFNNIHVEAQKYGVQDSDFEVFEQQVEDDKDTYPHLYDCWKNHSNLTPRAYYEMIVSLGGEGVMLKPIDGKYLHKRGWEYSKVKKFLTRELIIMSFDKPTREYKGKAPKDWPYRENGIPVTKHYFNKQVGNLVLGVLMHNSTFYSMRSDKQGEVVDPVALYPDLEDKMPGIHELCIMQVCECGGFDDDTRKYFTEHETELIGSVVEVKANEIFRDSGKLRHPRYMRMRPDKEPLRCVWEDHIL